MAEYVPEVIEDHFPVLKPPRDISAVA